LGGVIMEKSLIIVKIVKDERNKNKCGLKLDYSCYKYISKATVTKVQLIMENIYKKLPEELVLFHHVEDKPLFRLKEESEGIFIESPYIDVVKVMPEYSSWLEDFISSVKRDYAGFCLTKKRETSAKRAS
jgi:hypothetical protein